MKTSIVFPSRFLPAGALLIAIFLSIFASDASAACVTPVAGLVSWWRGETNALDHTGTNHGTLAGNTIYGAGRVGQGFLMDGSTDLVTVGNPTELQLQDFTIETWIKRGSSSIVSFGSFGIAVLFGYGAGGYALYMDPSGTVGLTKVGFDAVSSGVSITDTNFHHVAVTKVGSAVVFYVDGVAYPAAAYNPGFTFTTVAAIGARGDNLDNSFWGTIDEVSVYSRPLATNEIQTIYIAGSAGKCVSVAPPTCTTAPAGLVSWWRGEANALDQAGTNNGTLAGNTTYGLARVGQGFVFDGHGSVVQLGSPANLHFQDLTIETWIRRTSASVVSFNGNGNGHIFGFNLGGYGLYMDPSGTPTLSKIGINEVKPGVTITDTNLHHVAVTKVGGAVVFYVDGVAYPAAAYDPGFTFSDNAFIGGLGSFYTFFGTVDEVSVYNRALASNEIQTIFNAGSSGKCFAGTPPSVTTQPTNQTVMLGGTATFIVAASGTAPLSYQWRLNSTNIAGATTDTLVLTNVQAAAAGVYAVVVSNSVGTATSSNAVLTVNAALPGALLNVDFAAFGRVKVGFAAAGQANTDFWNDYTFPYVASASLSNLKRADGGLTSVGLTLENGAGQTLVSHPDLMYQVACYATDSGVITLTVTNLPAGEFDIYLYGHAGDSTANTVFQLLVGSNNYGNQATATDASWSLTNWIAGAQYVVYRGVTVTNGGAPVIVKCQPGVSGYTYLNGLQILAAGSTPPVIVSQPTNQSVLVGGTATFSVAASGPAPLSYQWRLNSNNIAGATADSLVLTNVQLAAAGVYSVSVSNPGGTVTSSNAMLTVNPLAPCAPPAAGLVSWWSAEGNAGDSIGNVNGSLYGGTTYAPGKVGQAFSFDGVDDSVTNPQWGLTNILDSYSMEFWAWPTAGRASTPEATSGIDGSGNQRYAIFPYQGLTGETVGSGISVGTNGVSVFEHAPSYLPALLVFDAPIIGWTHIAVVYSNRRPSLYINGVLVRTGLTSLNPSCPSTWLGERGAASANQGYYAGLLDEVSIYNRALATNEIQALFAAGSSGKCFTAIPPVITAQPATQTVTIGDTATFNMLASGSAPLNYQWRLNTTNIAGATADSLVLTNVQFAAAGIYSVVVSNSVGTVTSSNAVLTVNALPACGAPPVGLVSWWRGEGNTLDQVGGSGGTLAGNTIYGGGRVSQAFVLDGAGDGVSVGNPPGLQLQDFTIEAWIKRGSSSVVSYGSYGIGIIFGYGQGGYGLYLDPSGTPTLTRVGIDAVSSSVSITDMNLHHVAVTKVGSTVVFYVDGVAYPAAAYNPGFTFSTAAAIGARGDTFDNSFLGTIDELSIYNRSLSGAEIQGIVSTGGSGKCLVAFPAFIITQPANKTVLVGGNTTFSVTAGGTPPFSYQWRSNGTSIAYATNATLALVNVQASEAGNYSVEVGNWGLPVPVLSSNATLTVTYPPANVRLYSTNVVSGHPVTLPIRIAANGNENAVSFSLTNNPARLTFSSAQLGAFPPGTYFFVNTSQTNLGRVGVTVALPAGSTFAPGTQLLVSVTYDATIWLSPTPTTTTVGFGDLPMVRGLTDVNALALTATYTSGAVTLSGTDLEGDGAPRPGGSRSFTVSDFVQAGRFAAKLDIPAPGGEFQRADSAPRGTQGDGQIRVTDWVQAGLYFAGSNPLKAVGGPTLEVTPTGPLGPDALREVRVTGTNATQGVAFTQPVSLQAQGNENGVGFTVSFDPAAFTYQSASLGSGAPGANFNLNANQATSGKLGMVLVLPTGNSFAAGAREVAKVTLLPTAAGSYPVTLSDQLVLRGVSDPAANELPASYLAGTVIVNPHPTLLITRIGTNVVLSWPAMASGFNLESSTNATLSGGWGDVLDTPQAEGENLKVTLPVADQTRYFRLRHP